jgi:hypothetical protein
MDDWKATHRIAWKPRRGDTQVFEVMLTDEGAAYTREEWDEAQKADWERDAAGRWTFKGRTTPGGQNGTVDVEATQHGERASVVAYLRAREAALRARVGELVDLDDREASRIARAASELESMADAFERGAHVLPSREARS